MSVGLPGNFCAVCQDTFVPFGKTSICALSGLTGWQSPDGTKVSPVNWESRGHPGPFQALKTAQRCPCLLRSVGQAAFALRENPQRLRDHREHGRGRQTAFQAQVSG